MPIFNLTEQSYVHAVWFIGWEGADFMAMLYRDGPDLPWRMTHRFRYYHSPDPFDMKDKKNVYEMTAKEGSEATRQSLEEAMDGVTDTLAEEMEAKKYKLLVRGTGVQTIEMLAEMPWAHTKEATEEEIKAFERGEERT